MAWISTYNNGGTDSNKKILSDRQDKEGPMWFLSGVTWVPYERTVDVLEYEYTGITYAAAQTGQTALNDPPDVVAVIQRQNDANAYKLHVTETTYGNWTQVTP